MTLIDRRLRNLDLRDFDRVLCNRIRTLELDLRAGLQRLQSLSFSGSGPRNQGIGLRQQLSEFLEEPDGELARAIGRWPSASPAANQRLENVLSRGTRLEGEVAAFLKFILEHERGSTQLVRLRDQHSQSLPALWHAAGVPAQALLSTVRSHSGIEELLQQLEKLEATLVQRREALGLFRMEVLRSSRVDLDEGERHEIEELADLEEAMERLIQLAEKQGRELRTAAFQGVDVQAENHLQHLGARKAKRAAPGRLGTTERALARWKQLHHYSGS